MDTNRTKIYSKGFVGEQVRQLELGVSEDAWVHGPTYVWLGVVDKERLIDALKKYLEGVVRDYERAHLLPPTRVVD